MGRVLGAWRTKDPFNWRRDRTISNTATSDYNCGGYALRTFSWYCPNPYSLIDKIEELLNEGFNFDETENIMTEWMVQSMLSDFKGSLSVIEGRDVIEATKDPSKEVIAFRLGISCDDEDEWLDSIANGYTPDYDAIDTDFHFCVFRDGVWMEKCGDGDVRRVYNTDITAVWDGYIMYDGPIVFLEHTLNQKI